MAEKLTVGAIGAEVARLHQELRRKTFEVPAEEVRREFFGPGTRQAVLAYQREHRLPCSGEIDASTTALLSSNPQPRAGGISSTGATDARAVTRASTPSPNGPSPRGEARDGATAEETLGVGDTMTLRISVTRVSQGAQGADVAEVHHALVALGKSVPASEQASSLYGPGTVAAVRALQEDLGAAGTGDVDDATVRIINAKLANLSAEPRMVRGVVRDADGRPLAAGVVQIFGQDPAGEQLLGESPLQAGDGSYQISYQVPPERNGRVDLRVAVLTDNNLAETTPSGKSILTAARPLEVVDFVLGGDKHVPSTEYDFLLNDLKPFLGRRDLAELVEDKDRHDVSLLAAESGYPADRVAALVLAHKLATDTGQPAPVFYGLLRQGLPAPRAALNAVGPAERAKALTGAVDRRIVPKAIDGRKIEDFLGEFTPAPAGELQGLLGLNADELTIFVGQYLKSSQDPDTFWRQVAADPAWASRAADLKFTAQLAQLTNNHAPLVDAVTALPDVRQPSDLVRLSADQWTSLVTAPGVGVPPKTPGATAEEKTSNYVQQILAQVEAAFPTPYFAERLGDSAVATFLKAQPAYDLRTTYPDQFFKQNPAAAQSLTPSDRQQLRTFQRLHHLTGRTNETLALAHDMGSAWQIAQMDSAQFAERHKEVLSTQRANEIYYKAQQTHAAALALFAEHAADLNRIGFQALPTLDSQKEAALAASSIPDWETLFGTFDLCSCQECASVHGPAAYFVDMLHFLGENARAPLFTRRPDLGDIELSCENTNTPVPSIDLVNEVLENAVAPPPPFAPITLAAALEADLAQTVTTPALAAAFAPPLQAGARVETVEPATRWRIWDEPFAYSVVKDGATLNVAARSRQTTGSAAERRATPQYRNGAAYTELAQSVYPWQLPFDLPREEANVFLGHLGVARRELIEALRPAPEPFDPTAPVVWGGASATELATVEALLDRSALGYAELEALISTRFVNPTGALRIVAKPDAPVDTCDTTKLQVDGLTDVVLDRVHRFVRLWRKLGWTVLQADRAFCALVPNPVAPALTNELLVRLDHLQWLGAQLRLSVAQTLALWQPIDTAEPESLYGKLFYNPVVFKPQDDVFRLRPDGQELSRTDRPLADNAAALQAAFRLDPAALSLLIGRTDGKLNLANLSFIHRHAILNKGWLDPETLAAAPRLKL